MKAKVTGKNAFLILRAIKKMNVLDELVDLLKQQTLMSIENEEVLLLIKDKAEGKDVEEVFKDNPELHKKYTSVQSKIQELGFDLIGLIIDNVDKAEKEIFNALSKIYEIDVKELENEEFDITFERISSVISSESFQRFFTSIAK